MLQEDVAKGYLDPDVLYGGPLGNHITFLYNDDSGLIATEGGTHEQIYKRLPEWIEAEEEAMSEFWEENETDEIDENEMEIRARQILELSTLLGRALERNRNWIVSFWNDDYEVYRLLGPCLEALEPYIYNDKPVEIHTPFEIMNQRAAAAFSRERQRDTQRQQETRVSPEARERLALLRKLHLLRGDEKKAALKKLGLWNPEKAQHPWQKAAPMAGQKWWAMHSEEIEKIADSLEPL